MAKLMGGDMQDRQTSPATMENAENKKTEWLLGRRCTHLPVRIAVSRNSQSSLSFPVLLPIALTAACPYTDNMQS